MWMLVTTLVRLGLLNPQPLVGRREALAHATAAAATLAALHTTPAAAASNSLWLSGKSDPLRPTSKDKPDGTKRDPKYLSCLNDCVPRCQQQQGLERSDCFDFCQEECCATYQQCTYKQIRTSG